MLFTRECDYAIRILRALSGGEIINVQDIAAKEDISVPITYKLTRKLEQSGYIRSYRGSKGGYSLLKPLDQVALLDIFQVVDHEMFITECTDKNHTCSRNTCEHPCLVHREFCRLQDLVTAELQSKSIADIINGR